MIKIGLTGNIASGKSEATKIFNKLGIKTLCADTIVHNLFEETKIKKLIINSFKNYDILTDNELDRKKLGKIVFNNKEKKEELEKILHPIVIQKINKFYQENQSENLIIIDVPLLFENNLEYLFDKIILIYANDNIRFERIKKRNNFDDEHIKNIMKSQLSQESKKEKTDFIIINENKTLLELETEITELIDRIK